MRIYYFFIVRKEYPFCIPCIPCKDCKDCISCISYKDCISCIFCIPCISCIPFAAQKKGYVSLRKDTRIFGRNKGITRFLKGYVSLEKKGVSVPSFTTRNQKKIRVVTKKRDVQGIRDTRYGIGDTEYWIRDTHPFFSSVKKLSTYGSHDKKIKGIPKWFALKGILYSHDKKIRYLHKPMIAIIIFYLQRRDINKK